MSKKGNILVEPSHESKRGKYGLITTLWNRDIVEVLFKNAKEELLKQGVHKENIFHLEVPGAFELPLSAKRLGKRKDIDAIIALGAIIKGETPHFDMIANSCATGLINVSFGSGKIISISSFSFAVSQRILLEIEAVVVISSICGKDTNSDFTPYSLILVASLLE